MLRNMKWVCKKEQNAPLIRMWHGAIFPQSEPPSARHNQPSWKTVQSATAKKTVTSSYWAACSLTLGYNVISCTNRTSLLLFLHQQIFPTGMLKNTSTFEAHLKSALINLPLPCGRYRFTMNAEVGGCCHRSDRRVVMTTCRGQTSAMTFSPGKNKYVIPSPHLKVK